MEQAQNRLDSLRRQLQPNATTLARLQEPPGAEECSHDPIIIGAAVLDIQAHSSTREIEAGGTVPGSVRQTMGGVGRNIAQALAQLCRGMCKPLLISMVGGDPAGEAVVSQWKGLGLSCRGIVRIRDVATPAVVYCFNPDGSVAAGVAAVATFESTFTVDVLRQFSTDLQSAPLVILDGNLPAEVIQEACRLAKEGHARLFYEPVSTAKAPRGCAVLGSLDFASPNASELVAMAVEQRAAAGLPPLAEAGHLPGTANAEEEITALLPHTQSLLKAGLKHLVLTLGEKGAALLHPIEKGGASLCRVHHMPALPTQVANSSGAGDCLVAGTCMRLLQGGTPVASLAYGMAAAECAMQSEENVPPELSVSRIAARAKVALASLKSWTVPILP